MKRLVILIFLAICGTFAGLVTGQYLGASTALDMGQDAEIASGPRNIARLANQFVIPIIERERVTSMVMLSLSLEVTGAVDAVHAQEPRLRDQFLRVMFDHANTGGFKGNFTDGPRIDTLRRNLDDVARQLLGDQAPKVLITELVRQDK